MPRTLVALVLMLIAGSAPSGWTTVAANLTRAVFWEAMPTATVAADVVTIDGNSDGSLAIDRYGPQLHVTGDFGVVASLQTASADPAALALVDGSTMRRVEVGLEQGRVVFAVFDGSATEAVQRQSFASDAPLGPVTVELSRQADALVLDVSGTELTRIPDPGVFQTGTVLLGAHVATGNQLSLTSLEVQAPPEQARNVRIDRCTPSRLLAAGTESSGMQSGLWWIWLDDGFLRQADPGTTDRSYLVDVSPDERWMLYYAAPNSYDPATQRFVVDTWVMDLSTDERYKLVTGSAPLGWISDSTAVVLGEHPNLMALVPSGQQVPSQGTLVYPQSMRAAVSPNGQLQASVEKTPQGASGISILDVATEREMMHIPTGRGAPQVAWSPDSTRLAFTSGTDTPDGLLWQLRMASLTDHTISLVDITRDLHLHSVVWAPPLPRCA